MGKITSCRLCSSDKLLAFINFGECAYANDYVLNREDLHGTFPLNVIRCARCGSHQLDCDADPNFLFGDSYLYSTPEALNAHFTDYAKDLVSRLNLQVGSRILDVGGNNGMLCLKLKDLGMDVLNIEPSKNIALESLANGITTEADFFSTEKARELLSRFGKFDVVVSNNVMAHSPTVKDMVSAAISCLKDGGTFVMENAYLVDTVKNCDIGQIYAEHYFYHSITPLKKLYELFGGTLTDVTMNNAQCGSFRAFVKKASANPQVSERVAKILEDEDEFFNSSEYVNFADRVQIVAEDIQRYLDARKDSKIGILGVPAKLALVLQTFNIGKYFSIAFDDSELKWNRLVPGTDIKILPTSQIASSGCDILFIGAYNFALPLVSKFRDSAKELVTAIPSLQIWKS